MNKRLSHIAIIMDGNGRWAQRKGLPRSLGHIEGRQTAQNIIKEIQRKGIPYLTLFSFSAENWKRPQEEISMILGLCEEVMSKDKEFFHENKIKVNVIGETREFPLSLQKVISNLKKETSVYEGFQLTLALNYGGRQEILKALKRMREKSLLDDHLTCENLEAHLDTYGTPYPDLVIRTGNVKRLSNFLLWQTAYSELFFSPKMWPDFKSADLEEAISYYEKTERRYGGVYEVHRP